MIVIYMVKNCVNGKVYIGSTGNITDRFNEHKRDLNNSIHHNEHLQNAWNKYGSDAFEFKTLMVCPDSERNHCEQMFMDLYDSQNHEFGYNIRDADAHSVSEETRLKISKANTGKTRTREHKQKISEALKGKKRLPFTDEHKRKISESRKGIFPSEETKLKMSESHSGEKNPRWKDYARIINAGHIRGKQRYAIKFNGKKIKHSLNIFKLLDWFFEEYPDEDLEISMEVLNNALLF